MINPLRAEYISSKVELEGKTLLDVGCGGGILCESLARLGANITGIDPSDNNIKYKKFKQSGAMPPADYKCLICDKVVTPGTLKTFNMHLKSSHFNQELLSAFLKKQPPYACSNNSCADSSLTIGVKAKEFKSPMDLLDHMIDSHNLVLDMYYEHIRVKQTQRAVHGSTSQTCDTDEFSSQNGVEHTTVKKAQSPLIHESVFVCIVCKNKNNNNHMQDFFNAYTTCKGLGNERSQPEVAIPYGIFVKEKMLRDHLIDAHFKDLIVKMKLIFYLGIKINKNIMHEWNDKRKTNVSSMQRLNNSMVIDEIRQN